MRLTCTVWPGSSDISVSTPSDPRLGSPERIRTMRRWSCVVVFWRCTCQCIVPARQQSVVRVHRVASPASDGATFARSRPSSLSILACPTQHSRREFEGREHGAGRTSATTCTRDPKYPTRTNKRSTHPVRLWVRDGQVKVLVLGQAGWPADITPLQCENQRLCGVGRAFH